MEPTRQTVYAIMLPRRAAHLDVRPTQIFVLLMPIISTFFGIVIRMYYKEHEPAHFHAKHSGQQGTFDFDGAPIAGAIDSRRALRRIRQWAQCIGLISRGIGRK